MGKRKRKNRSKLKYLSMRKGEVVSHVHLSSKLVTHYCLEQIEVESEKRKKCTRV